jgi:hypothetical protein
MERRQKRKANVLPAEHYEAVGGSARALPGVARAKDHVFGAEENVVSAPALSGVARPKVAKSGKKRKQAKEPEKGKEAKEPDPPADEGGSRSAAGYHIKQRPPPAGVPRGVRGTWMLAQHPRKYDEDGNPIGDVQYSECYLAP